jgi:hypothetical protein
MPRFALRTTTITVLAAGCIGGLASAQTFTDETGGKVTAYGQFSPIYLGYDDGEKSYGNAADNAISNSRVGLRLDRPLSDGLTFGVVLETALGAPQSSDFSQDGGPDWAWEETDLRKFEMTLGGDFGKIHLGQGSMATDGVAERDLSGTTLAGYVNRADTAGGYAFRETGGELSGITITDAFKDYDGSRKFRIRYDTPDWNGASVRMAYGDDILTEGDEAHYYDIAVSYGSTLGTVEMDGALGYSWKDDGGAMTEAWMGSFSAIHRPSGIDGTIAAGGDAESGSYVYGKLGLIRAWLSVGSTALSVDYYSGTDFATKPSASESWGFQAVQTFDDVNLEAYLSYASYSFDGDASYQDGSSTTMGLRWKF